MSEPAPWTLTATELGVQYRAGALSPLEALDAVLARLDAVNPIINAVITLDRSGAEATARASAERWRGGSSLSPLDGVPVTIKDNLFVAGLRATWGSRLYADFVAPADEPAVARLRAAGAVILGKTNVPEFTLQGYTDNALFGVTRNPNAPDRTPGGSTGGGAAAVVAGIGPIAIGTDGGGSLRRPAAHCGLYALKPSIGQVARYGGFPQILADFEVIGPVARSVDDLALAFGVLRGHDPHDPRSLAALAPPRPFARPRIGYFRSIAGAPVDPRILAEADIFADALAADGCSLEPIPAPFDPDVVNAAWGTVAAAGLSWHIDRIPGADGHIGSNATTVRETGRGKTVSQYLEALAFATEARIAAAALFERFDVLLCPATAALAWPAAEAFPPEIAGLPVGPRGHAIFTAWGNLTGVAAATVPVGMTEHDGGIGIQLIAAPGRDLDLLSFMRNAPAIREIGIAGLSKGPVEK